MPYIPLLFQIKHIINMADNINPFGNPGEDAEKALLEIILDKPETVYIREKKYTIKALKKGTRLFVSDIIADSKESGCEENDKEGANTDHKAEDKILAKCAAAYILNSYWTLSFFFGIAWKVYWRWLYYIRQYTDADYYDLLQVCKKKAEKQTSAYTMNIILLTAMKATTMTMTRKEVKRIRLEKSTEPLGAQQKNSLN